MAKKPRAGAPVLGQAALAQMKAAEDMAFPCALTITNDTPRLLIFHDVGLQLFGNTRTLLKGEKNSDTVTFKDKDQYVRFESDVEIIARNFKYSRVVTIAPAVVASTVGEVPVIPPPVGDDAPEASAASVAPVSDPATNTAPPEGSGEPASQE
jgi:hypothetical protein